MKKGMVSIAFLITLFVTTNLYASELYMTKGGWLGAVSKQYFDLLAKRIDDIEAIKKMMNDGVIFIIDEGLTVYIESQSLNVVELSLIGGDFSFWTFSEAIKKK